MSWTERKTLSDAEVPAARDLFERIIEAEKDTLSADIRADPRKYLLETWRAAAETVMRPLHRVEELAADLARQRLENERAPDIFSSVLEDY